MLAKEEDIGLSVTFESCVDDQIDDHETGRAECSVGGVWKGTN